MALSLSGCVTRLPVSQPRTVVTVTLARPASVVRFQPLLRRRVSIFFPSTRRACRAWAALLTSAVLDGSEAESIPGRSDHQACVGDTQLFYK